MSVKWGVLGTASIAKGCTIPGMQQADNCEIYAIAGRNEEKVNKYKEEFGFKKGYVGYDALLEDPDVEAVYIPLPNDIHYEWVIKALKAKKHVLCEKPLALNAAQVKEMFKISKENDVYLMEAYAYLHSPYIKVLKEDIASGVIGDVDYIETAFVTQSYKEDIRLHKETGGGAVYDLGCYCTTMILSLTEGEPEYVKACAEFNEFGVDVLSTGIMKFKNDVRAAWNVGMILGKNTDERMDRLYIRGSKGVIKSPVEYNQEGELTYDIIVDGNVTKRTVHARKNYALEIEQFGRCVENIEQPFITEEFSMRNAKILDAILGEIGY
ncbi:MAG: Gfo/Idh/MocA family oxidoreductase [Lachnospiraceae bacterium]|nr:Gfo/Idh/MocA family oxidoreductase [Lachnospiraceae bacterium]